MRALLRAPAPRWLSRLSVCLLLLGLLAFFGRAFADTIDGVDTATNLGIVLACLARAGLANLVAYVVCAVTICSALDLALPQPAAGSHWLPVRKVVSIIALSFGNAANVGQPNIMTWVARVLKPLIDAQIAQQQAKAVPPVVPAPAPAPAQIPVIAVGDQAAPPPPPAAQPAAPAPQAT